MDGEQTTPSSRPHPSSRFAAVTQRNGRAGNRGKDGSESGDLEDEGISPAEQLSRKSLKAYTAEDILRDKNLLRQQLEVRGNLRSADRPLKMHERRERFLTHTFLKCMYMPQASHFNP